jgi:heme exporter protein A
LSFEIRPSDVVHLAGPNGSGKTSLLRIMAGALPYEGEILWEGRDFLENDAAAHAARFSFLPADDRNLKLLETAAENLGFWARLSGGELEGPPDVSLAAMDIAALKDKPVRYFSAGQKRRLSLARMMQKPARLWLLDEPLNGLDAPSATLFQVALDKHIANGGMAVIASHHAIEPPKHGTLRRIVLGAEQRMAA